MALKPIDIRAIEIAAADIPVATNGLSQPAFYADHIQGGLMLGAVAKMNFVEVRADAQSSEIKTIHVATVITPLTQLRPWAKYLSDLADRQGIPPLNGEDEESA